MKISWTENLTKWRWLVRANELRSMLKTIWCRKHKCLNLLHDIIEEKMLGKAACGRKRTELWHDIM